MNRTGGYDSSDSVRSASALRHARTFVIDGPVELESGGVLPSVTVCYETYGTLDEDRTNAVLVCHAISGDSHVARHDEDDGPGWWDAMVGPGKPVDTERYFVICSNVLGSCRGTTGPNFPIPGEDRPYGADFPVVTVGDMVRVQAALLDDLGIDRLRAVIGGSLGGFQALRWATAYPGRVLGCVPVATGPRLSAQGIAFDVVGRNAIRQDAGFRGGQYETESGPEAGLAIARMLAHVTYLSREAMESKFDATRLEPREVATAFEKKFSVGSYLAYQGHKFVERFDANSYITLSMAMDLFDLGAGRSELADTLGETTCRWLLLSFTSDWLYPPAGCRAIVDALLAERKAVSYCNVECDDGHDSFLLDDGLAVCGPMIAAFLERLGENGPPSVEIEDEARDDVTSIFHEERLDYDLIVDLVPEGASVLDVGCGNGELLARLRERGHSDLIGVERDENAVVDCVARGLDVVQSDADAGLSAFADSRFDIAILSQTVQSLEDVAGALAELVRVGSRAIVSFPNFAHRPMREMFYREGRLPKEQGLYAYEWHDTPNRRFPSIIDFRELCETRGFRILREIDIDTTTGLEVTEDPNLEANVAIVVLSR